MIMNKEQMKYVANLISQDLEKDKEIERLSKEVDMWNRKYNEQIDIINELEKGFRLEIKRTEDIRENQYCLGRYDSALDNLDKLKELKEGKQ